MSSIFNVLKLPTSTEALSLALSYEEEQERALQEGNVERANMWGARADSERYISQVLGKTETVVRND